MSLIHGSELSIFSQPMISQGVKKYQYVNYRPSAVVDEKSVIDINIPPSASQYIDMSNIRLRMRLQIRKPNGDMIDANSKVSFTATPVHSMFSQIDVFLQQQAVTSSTNLYPYRAYISKLLQETTDHNYPQHMSELYILDGSPPGSDVPNNMGQTDPTIDPKAENYPLRNEGLTTRARHTALGRTLDLESKIYCDICSIQKYILNGVSLRFKFYPSTDAFRLISGDGVEYKFKILDIYLKVPMVTISPEVFIAQNETLQTYPARYPYYRWLMSTHMVPRGQYMFNIDQPFLNRLPGKVFVAMTSSQSFNGDYRRNPFDLRHHNITSATFLRDGQSIPHQPLTMNFTDFFTQDITGAYNALLRTAGKTEGPFDITHKRFKDGFTILGFDLEPLDGNSLEYWAKSPPAHTRIEIKFSSPLTESLNVILIGITPEILSIDHARNVTTTIE